MKLSHLLLGWFIVTTFFVLIKSQSFSLAITRYIVTFILTIIIYFICKGILK